jgi:hypothetical protein
MSGNGQAIAVVEVGVAGLEVAIDGELSEESRRQDPRMRADGHGLRSPDW